MIEYLPHMACLFGGAIVGFGVRAVLTAGKEADAQDMEPAQLRKEYADGWLACFDYGDDLRAEAEAAHARVTDALSAKNARIATLTDIARSQKSVKSGRIIDVLEG
jgi:hypothetical protein